MKQNKVSRPGSLPRMICVLLAFLMMLSAFGAVLLFQVQRIMTDRNVYLTASTALQDEQWAWLEEKCKGIGENQHFSPEILKGILTPEVLSAQREVLADWLIAAFSGSAEPVPQWSEPALIDAICADEAFQAAVIPAMRQLTARDQAGAAVSAAINQAVLPMRTSMLQMGMSFAGRQVNLSGLVTWLPMGWKQAAVVCVVLSGLMLLIMCRYWVQALPYMAAGVSAGGWLTVLTLAVLWLLDLPGMTATVSVPAAHLLAGLGMQLLPSVLMAAVGLLVVGQLLLLVNRRLSR